MNTESICVSLEWAKKLKECGLSPRYTDNFIYVDQGGEAIFIHNQPLAIVASSDMKFYPAPTAEDILRELPDGTQVTRSCDRNYHCECGEIKLNADILRQTFPTAANACAAVYCYLAENNLLPTQTLHE